MMVRGASSGRAGALTGAASQRVACPASAAACAALVSLVLFVLFVAPGVGCAIRRRAGRGVVILHSIPYRAAWLGGFGVRLAGGWRAVKPRPKGLAARCHKTRLVS